MKHPSPIVALLPVVFLITMVSVAVSSFGSDSLNGANQMILLGASMLTVFIGMAFYKTKWADIEQSIVKNIGGVAPAILILLMIGALSSTWMLSGIVPTLICYGLDIISPQIFLASTCIICAIVSVLTGSSWTTVATIGIALMGIGTALGFPDGWTAGAIISGAYFGDKISPLSDTTVLTSSTCDVPLFTHIRYMMFTTIPSITIALVVFCIAGFQFSVTTQADTAAFSQAINEKFVISPWLLIVPVLTGVLIAKKVPALITLSISALMAMVTCVIAQQDVLREICDGNLFDGMMLAFFGPTALLSSNETVSSLIDTNGMAGMLNTVWLIICAITFGATMQATKMLEAITLVFVKLARGLVGLVAISAFTGILLNTITSDQYLSIILNSKMFGDVFKQRGYENRLLSRTVEDSTTVTSVLIPWNTCGMTQSTVLDVATITYMPYAIFCYISPLMSIFVAALISKYKVPSTKYDYLHKEET